MSGNRNIRQMEMNWKVAGSFIYYLSFRQFPMPQEKDMADMK